MKNLFHYFFLLFFLVFLIIISVFSYSTKNSIIQFSNSTENSYYFSNEDYFWPLPGFHTISSYFGKRISPTTGASSNHSGIDVVAPEGTSIYSILSGKVIFTGFSGANGHTIIIESNNIKILYCHISPSYIVSIGNIVEKGELISYVGPKYISDVINNPYKDSSGKFTNGATTGCHLHLTIKENDIPVNPLMFFY